MLCDHQERWDREGGRDTQEREMKEALTKAIVVEVVRSG